MTQERNIILYKEVKRLLKKAGYCVDLMKLEDYAGGLGCWELDVVSLNAVGEIEIESSSIHEASIEDIDISEYNILHDGYELEYVFERLDDAKVFHWEDLSDGDKEELPIAIRAYIKAEKEGTLLD